MARMAGEISESFGSMAYAAVKRVGAQDRVVAWGGICSVDRMNPVHADHLRAHSAEVRGGRVRRG